MNEASLHLWSDFFFFFFPALGLELRAYTLSHSTGLCLWWVFFQIGSFTLLAPAGFEL
jgi:hypothetical protein